MRPHEQILQAIVVTAELTGTELSPAAQAVMVDDLMAYPLPAVLAALTRCRKELTGRLTLAAVLERLADFDGRPGAEEAWGMVAATLSDERESIVWSDEMAEASIPARELMLIGDKVGARMAFRETYERLVHDARDAGKPPRWTASAGTDPDRRAAVLMRAVELERLPAASVAAMLPYQASEERHLLLTGKVMTPEERRIGQQRARALLAMIPVKKIEEAA